MKTLKIGRSITIPVIIFLSATGVFFADYFRKYFTNFQDKDSLKKGLIVLSVFSLILVYELIQNNKNKEIINITEEGIYCREGHTDDETFIRWEEVKGIDCEVSYLNKGSLIGIYVNEKYDGTFERCEITNTETNKRTIDHIVNIDTSETRKTKEICNVIKYNLRVFNREKNNNDEEKIDSNKIAVAKGLLDLVHDEGIAEATGLDINTVTEIRLGNIK